MKIDCVGGGPAGLYSAIQLKLRDPGREVTVYERNPPAVTHGWGVTLWEESVAALRDVDPVLGDRLDTCLHRWDGLTVQVTGKAPARTDGHAFSISRCDLTTLLADRASELGVDVRFEREIEAAAAEAGDADLVIAADGVGSRVRERRADAFGAELHTGRNRFLWLGTTKVFDAFTWGLTKTDHGWIWLYAYGTESTGGTVVIECGPETWEGLALDRLAARDNLELLESLFASQLDGGRLLAGRADDEPLAWDRFRSVTNRSWYADNIVLVGDAAHSTHFSIGSGTCIAFDDATTLADALDEHSDLTAALEGYSARRLAEVTPAQARARLSERFYEHMDRYATLDPPDLLHLLLRRDSPLVHRLPLARYVQLRDAVDAVALPAWMRRAAGRGAGALLHR